MHSSPARFAELLTTAVLLIKARNGRNLEAIQDELGYALKREGAYYIQYLRKGHVPSSVDDVLDLTRQLIRLKGLTSLRDCEQILESAGVPRAAENARELWGAAGMEVVPSRPVENSPAFIVGPPINQPRLFFGRAGELTRIFGCWRSSPFMHITLVGPRRSGKTSLLHYLSAITTTPPSECRKGQRTDWLPEPHRYRWIWIDFEDPRMRVRERLLQHLLAGCGIEVPQPCTLESFADAMDSHAWDAPCIVLMDELERGLASPELDQDFWHCLRALMNMPTQGNLGFLLSSHAAPQDLAEERGKTSPFFNMFQTLELGPFTEAEARELIAGSPIPFPEPDIAWILSRSGHWPCLLQILCQERLMALQQNEAGEDWHELGLRHMTPFRYLLDAGQESSA
jgi:hypothetical protein